MKRGQIQNQIFIYAVGIIVVGLILVFSYSAIKGLGKQADDVALVKFQKDVTSDIESVRKNFGNIRVFTYSVPSGYSKLCFVDITKDCSTCDPLIKDSVLSGVSSNMFLVKNSGGFEAYSVGSLTIDEDFSGIEDPLDKFGCFSTGQGSLSIRLVGKGDHVFVTK